MSRSEEYNNHEKDYPAGEIVLYTSQDGKTRLECRFEDESIWLSQTLLAELYQKDIRTINEHIKNIYKEEELNSDATLRKFRIVRTEGNRTVEREIDHYNLEVILAVGYRVHSQRGTQFRRWATEKLKEYLVKGFVMDDERLKNPSIAGSAVPDYFDEMLARIRDIRASERRMYLRVKEIFAMAADYDLSLAETAKFFSIIQNKLHYAATGLTAAELIQSRANHEVANMGLTSWKSDELRKTDVTSAKNYLNKEEIDELNRIVVMWLDYAEDQAERRKQIFMKDWEQKLDEFLRFNERNVLPNAGKASKQSADDFAKKEYDLFEIRRREYKETIGETETIHQLEETAKLLSSKMKGKKKRGEA